ncbi:eukaryotic translation initiation factor 5B isoform X2 [Exaiptasia diaphana]|uniref:Eukaryotic translation initiation factor 5B n=1 Tax=Exaiptasia diaphana TaxID=2652724 RepID=A0A913Y6B2_EXADI|nr:eukaryotic translation initiation factor 5B isoform X2 [Exaiptasia diaphana]
MGKPKKGARKKANDDWEDDVLNEIESMNNGTDGASKDPPTVSKNSRFMALENEEPEEGQTPDDPENQSASGKAEQKKSKKDKKTKNMFDALEVEDDVQDDNAKNDEQTVDSVKNDDAMSKKAKKGKKNKKKFDIDDLDEDDDLEISDKKEVKSKPANTETINDNDVKDDEYNDENGPIVKTAAQKRAEKKERERKKKALEKEKQKQKAKKAAKPDEDKELEINETPSQEIVVDSEKTEEGAKEPSTAADQEPKTDMQNDKLVEENKIEGKEECEEEEEGGDDKKKKKKKKKKKAGEEEEKKVKKPNKALVKQMQQQLEALRLEEERKKKEEEEKLRALEEAENRRLEKLRLEEERKQKRKQKEKERKERQRKEGKLLTKAQKEQKAKQQAHLEALRQQGIEIPALSNQSQDVIRKPVRYGSKKPKNKQQQQQQQQQDEVEVKDVEMQEDREQDKEQEYEESKEDNSLEPGKELKESNKGKEEEVKDAWDIGTDSEDEKDDEKEEKDITITKETDEVSKPDESSSEETEESSSEEEDEEDEEEEDEEDEEEESESEEDTSKSETVEERIEKRKVQAELNRNPDHLRSPVICVLGHVDTGKTKILDKIRHTHVQDGEAGGITQQIGATMVPPDAIRKQTSMMKEFQDFDMKIPGLLIIDTPGHESFSNLRNRGSSLCDMAILVVDIMHGLEPQTIESINLLKAKKTPFVVALNKVDRLFEWKRGPDSSIMNTIRKQKRHTKQEFEERVKIVIQEFAEQGLNATLYYDNKDTRSYVSLIPTSAHSGDGMGDLISQVVELTQTRLPEKLSFSEYLDGIVLEVKALPGLGTTVDVILVNGTLREGDTLVLSGIEGPIVTQIRALLTPQPLKELRVKNQYVTHKELRAAQGVKIAAKDLEKALAGVPIMVAEKEDEIDYCKNEVSKIMSDALKAIRLSDRGVYVQASTLGSLEALLEFLKTSKIPYAGVNIGPVHKKDVMKCSIMLEHEVQYAVILAFDVKIEREAQDLADSLGIKVFSAEIIYHLFDKFTEYREEQKRKKRDEFKNIAVFPCKLRILPQHIFNSRDPIIVGVSIEAGIVKEGTPICVPSKSFIDVGVVSSIETNHKNITEARKGMEVCLKIENIPGETPKLYGRHFDHEDLLVSKISRESINAVKEYFREDLQKSDWQLMIELKKLFQIL